MTEHNNSNAEDERPTPQHNGEQSVPKKDVDSEPLTSQQSSIIPSENTSHNGAEHVTQKPDNASSEDDWQAFEQAYAQDLAEVAQSRNAKRFEQHAQRKEKEALLSVNDLNGDSFAPGSSQGGPRDFTSSSWLETDSIMDRYGDDFVPPNPTIGHVNRTKLVFWVLFIAGIAGIIATVFFPVIAGILGTIFGVCALVGGAGLLLQHRDSKQVHTDYFDDGARV